MIFVKTKSYFQKGVTNVLLPPNVSTFRRCYKVRKLIIDITENTNFSSFFTEEQHLWLSYWRFFSHWKLSSSVRGFLCGKYLGVWEAFYMQKIVTNLTKWTWCPTDNSLLSTKMIDTICQVTKKYKVDKKLSPRRNIRD